MKTQYGFIVNSARCIGCFTCAMACKNQNQLDPGIKWRDVHPLAKTIYPHEGRAFYSLACNHCQQPCCIEACPVGAYSKRDKDGIVVHDQDKCIGCKNCVRSCPFGAPVFNPEKQKAEKCSLCYQRIDAGLAPACTQACPTEAIQIAALSSQNDTGLVQYPPGFPAAKKLNPSTRFYNPRQPEVIRRKN